jgi:glucosamine--fructose-6-phosphate aminotransferase (isomerizing)
MCGIVGYIGTKNDPSVGIEALKRLEYRGYDSSGMAVLNKEKKEITCIKAVGKIVALEQKFINSKECKGSPFILHTRWATHGSPTEINAHPHHDCKKKIWVVHNGIIENYKELKEKLQKQGHKFVSETDTEVLAHLIEHFFKGTLEEAVRQALKKVEGTYAMLAICIDDPDKIVAARNSSPLAIAVNNDEIVVASDAAALLSHSKRIIFLDDKEVATLKGNDFCVCDLDNRTKEKELVEIDWDVEEAQKSGYPHFMLKEIMEQPDSLRDSQRGRTVIEEGNVKLGGLQDIKEKLRSIKRIIIVACGTAYHAGLVGEYMLEEYAGIPVEVEYASEFRYRKPIINKGTSILAISQSGETADTLAAIREGKEKGAITLGIVNTVGSTIARETDAGVYNHCGPEIGVASTKAFSSQVEILALLTVLLGRQREMSVSMGERIVKEIIKLPDLVKETLEINNQTEKLAQKYKNFLNFLFVGRKYNFPIALEGALKLKEISYIHSEGYGAGEMKHGPIALIDEQFPTIAVAPTDSVYEKMISNIEEIKARKGPVVVITTKGNEKIEDFVNDVIYIPKTIEMLSPILTAIPMQLFAYYVGIMKKFDVDKPRNLAKSVTVE